MRPLILAAGVVAFCSVLLAEGVPDARKQPAALRKLLTHPSARERWTAAEALWRLEHKAGELVPVYVDLLTTTEPDLRAASAWRLGRFGDAARPAVPVLAAALRDENLEVRVQVAQALANLGTVAEPALPALVRALGDPRLDEGADNNPSVPTTVRSSPALMALVEFEEKALPPLLATFRNAEGLRGHVAALRAAHACAAFGPAAVAPLVQALDAPERDVRAFALAGLEEVAQVTRLPPEVLDRLEKALEDPDDEVRARAARALAWGRPTSNKAVPRLAELSRGGRWSEHGEAARGALERMRPHNAAARRVLAQQLTEERKDEPRQPGAYRPPIYLPTDQVIDVWPRAIAHTDPAVRTGALQALATLGTRGKEMKASLLVLYPKETDDSCRAAVIDALVAIDPIDPALVPFLIQAVDDRKSYVQWRALDALAVLGPRASATLPTIERNLLPPEPAPPMKDLESSRMRDLVSALVSIAPGTERTAEVLLQALRRREVRGVHCPKNTWFMRDRLEDELVAAVPAAVPLLRAALSDAEVAVRQSVALVLLRTGHAAEKALMENLFDGQTETRFQHRAVRLLSRRSAVSPGVAAAWCRAWQTADPKARAILEPGLLALQAEALPHLLRQWADAKTAEAKRGLAHLLAHYERPGKELVPILREELRDAQPESQCQAALALRRLGPDAAAAVPDLAALLKHPDPALQTVAAETLAVMGPAAQPAARALLALLRDGAPDLRIVAASALSRVAPERSEALTVLRDALVSGTQTRYVELPGKTDHQAIPYERAEQGIARCGARGIAVLADLLDNTDLDAWSLDNISTQCGSLARVRAAHLLADLGAESAPAVPALVRALDDKDPFVRDAAASALGRSGPAAQEAAPACLRLLEQQQRRTATGGLWEPGARFSVADAVRPFEFRSLGRGHILGRAAFSNYDYDLYAALRPSHPHDPAAILSRIDTKRSALPVLTALAGKAGHPGRLAAALAVWRSGGDTADLIPVVRAALQENQSGPLPRELRACLAELDKQLQPASKELADWLRRREAAEPDRIAVIEALGRLRLDAPATDLLRGLLPRDRYRARTSVAAALALFRSTGDRATALPLLHAAFDDSEQLGFSYSAHDPADSARVAAVRALGDLAEAGDERATGVVHMAAKGDDNVHVQLAALEAEVRLKTPAALSGLARLLRHPEQAVRSGAAAACGRLGPLAKTAVAALRAGTDDMQLAVRQAARQALELVR